MKLCPLCRTPYTDSSLNYCLKDGTALIDDVPSGYASKIDTLKFPGDALDKVVCTDKWLHDIAVAQKQTIQDYVRVDCWLLDFDVLHNSSLYIDFRFSFTSSCVYKLSLKGIEGRIHFANKPFHEAPTVVSNELKKVAIGEVGWLTVRQKLNVEEAVSLLHSESGFSFNQFHIELVAEPGGIESGPLHIDSKASNKLILKQTPKLIIEVLESKIDGLYDRETHPGEDSPEQGSVLNVRVKIQNPRPVPVEVKRLMFRVPPKQNIPAQEGQICDYVLLQFGEIKQTRNILKNLNKCPIYLDPQSQPIEGWLQFIIIEVDAASWERGSSATLIALDSRYEEHHLVFAPVLSVIQS